MQVLTTSPHKQDVQQHELPKKKKKKKTASQLGITGREFYRLNAKMNRVLETVAAYPTPESDRELNIRLTSIVQEVVKKEITKAERLREARIRALEEASLKNIIFIDELFSVQGAPHGVDIAEKYQ